MLMVFRSGAFGNHLGLDEVMRERPSNCFRGFIGRGEI
jgi:hypothetical protein